MGDKCTLVKQTEGGKRRRGLLRLFGVLQQNTGKGQPHISRFLFQQGQVFRGKRALMRVINDKPIRRFWLPHLWPKDGLWGVLLQG